MIELRSRTPIQMFWLMPSLRQSSAMLLSPRRVPGGAVRRGLQRQTRTSAAADAADGIQEQAVAESLNDEHNGLRHVPPDVADSLHPEGQKAIIGK